MFPKPVVLAVAFSFIAGCMTTYETKTVSAQPARLTKFEDAETKRLITKDFKDPESARFRSVQGYRLSNRELAVCGEVNGRNSYGAYVGYKKFYIRIRPMKEGLVLKAVKHELLADQSCNEVARTQSLKIAIL